VLIRVTYGGKAETVIEEQLGGVFIQKNCTSSSKGEKKKGVNQLGISKGGNLLERVAKENLKQKGE